MSQPSVFAASRRGCFKGRGVSNKVGRPAQRSRAWQQGEKGVAGFMPTKAGDVWPISCPQRRSSFGRVHAGKGIVACMLRLTSLLDRCEKDMRWVCTCNRQAGAAGAASNMPQPAPGGIRALILAPKDAP